MPSLKAANNVRWGLAWGCAAAALVSALAGLIGPDDEGFNRMVGAYFAGGITSGLVVGILRPFVRSYGSAAIVGMMTALPSSFAISVGVWGAPWVWHGGDLVFTLIYGALLGSVVGLHRFHTSRR